MGVLMRFFYCRFPNKLNQGSVCRATFPKRKRWLFFVAQKHERWKKHDEGEPKEGRVD